MKKVKEFLTLSRAEQMEIAKKHATQIEFASYYQEDQYQAKIEFEDALVVMDSYSKNFLEFDMMVHFNAKEGQEASDRALELLGGNIERRKSVLDSFRAVCEEMEVCEESSANGYDYYIYDTNSAKYKSGIRVLKVLVHLMNDPMRAYEDEEFLFDDYFNMLVLETDTKEEAQTMLEDIVLERNRPDGDTREEKIAACKHRDGGRAWALQTLVYHEENLGFFYGVCDAPRI